MGTRRVLALLVGAKIDFGMSTVARFWLPYYWFRYEWFPQNFRSIATLMNQNIIS